MSRTFDKIDMRLVLEHAEPFSDEESSWFEGLDCVYSAYEVELDGVMCINIHVIPEVLFPLSKQVSKYCTKCVADKKFTDTATAFDGYDMPKAVKSVKDCMESLFSFMLKHSWQFTSDKNNYDSVLANLRSIVGDDVPLETVLKTVIDSIVLMAVNEDFPTSLKHCLYEFYTKEVNKLYGVELNASMFEKNDDE